MKNITDLLAETNSPLLTFYGEAERTELSGPVLARWLSKTLNMLRDRNVTSLNISLPPHWRSLIWHCAAYLGDITVGDNTESYGLVTNSAQAAADATWDSQHVWIQDMGALSLRYNGTVPNGVNDAIVDVSSYPDVLSEAATPITCTLSKAPDANCVLVCGGSSQELAKIAFSLWLKQKRLVWAPKFAASTEAWIKQHESEVFLEAPAAVRKIIDTERCDAVIPPTFIEN